MRPAVHCQGGSTNTDSIDQYCVFAEDSWYYNFGVTLPARKGALPKPHNLFWSNFFEHLAISYSLWNTLNIQSFVKRPTAYESVLGNGKLATDTTSALLNKDQDQDLVEELSDA